MLQQPCSYPWHVIIITPRELASAALQLPLASHYNPQTTCFSSPAFSPGILYNPQSGLAAPPSRSFCHILSSYRLFQQSTSFSNNSNLPRFQKRASFAGTAPYHPASRLLGIRRHNLKQPAADAWTHSLLSSVDAFLYI